MIDFFSDFFLIFYALLFGFTMKIADLLDEHGLKLFSGSKIVFGFLWGFFGLLLLLGSNLIANILLAMSLAFLVRNRLDYLNHQIAASIIIFGFLFSANFEPILFLSFYLAFVLFGSLRDFIGDKIKDKKKIHKIYDNFMWYYPLSTLVYCALYGNWIVFWIFLTYTISYDLTKYLYARKRINKK